MRGHFLWRAVLLIGVNWSAGIGLSVGIGYAATDDVDLSSVPRAVLQSEAYRYLEHCRENPGNGVWDLVANRSVTCEEYLNFPASARTDLPTRRVRRRPDNLQARFDLNQGR